MTATIRSVLRECAEKELAERGRCVVDDVVADAFAAHGDVFAAQGELLARQSARNITKDILAEFTKDEEEHLALGLHFPTAIAVRSTDDAIYYVRADRAIWSELTAGLAERRRNVTTAEARLASYEADLNRLRPYMEHDPAMTVAEALRREQGAA